MGSNKYSSSVSSAAYLIVACVYSRCSYNNNFIFQTHQPLPNARLIKRSTIAPLSRSPRAEETAISAPVMLAESVYGAL